MADTRVTPLEITRKFLAVFHSNCVFAKNLNSDYEKSFGSQSGYDAQKIGPTLNIREPIQANVRTGWGMQQQDVTESYKSLTIDTVRGIDLKFSDADLALSIDDFVPRYIEAPAKKLAAVIDQYVASYMMAYIPNCVAQSGLAVPTSLDTYLEASAKMKQALVPFTDGINMVIDPVSERKIVNELSKGYYNPQMRISEIFEKGQMAGASGFDWYMSQVLPTYTAGSQNVSDTPIVGTFVAGTPTSLPYTSATTSGTWAAGQVFTIAGLYDVNYETKAVLPNLKQFSVTTLNTASAGAGTLTIEPGIIFDTTSAKQNCYIAAGTIDGAAIVMGALDGTTSVPTTYSTSYGCNIAFHKDSFAFASVPLIQPRGLDMASTVTVDNLSFRFLRGYDIVNARMLSRVDIFFGITALRPQWACKILHV